VQGDTVIAGRYRLDAVLGRGGMSEVWRAEDGELGRLVAIKLLAPDADHARFEREARAVASLGHPNIMQVYDYGEWEGRPYMVLECLPGGTLEDRLAAGKPLPDDEAAAVAAGTVAGLAHAHSRGVIHRDLKPANVLFDDEGRPKLADFGIARLAAGEGTLTEAGTVLGTAAYISPEQAAGEPASAASDVYSFGVILYRMLTGRLPFVAANPMELVRLHRDEQPPPLEAARPDAPPQLAAVVAAALAKDPRDRPHDGAALAALLGLAPTTASAATTALLADDATRVLPTAPPPQPRDPEPAAAPPPRRSRAPLATALLLLLAAAGGALAYAMTRSGSPVPGVASTTTLPTKTRHTTPTTTAATTQAATQQTTSAQTTTEQTTSAQTTTQARTTAPPPTTTAPPPPTTLATTVVPPTTTEPPTTAATTVATTVTTP
jgi:serine/threonine protein kinase